MNPRTKNIISGVFILVVLGGLSYYLFKKNLGTVSIPGSETPPAESPGTPVSYLKAPAGVNTEFFASGVPGARVIAFDEKGRMLVSQTGEGKVALIESSGAKTSVKTLASGLNQPHGLAFHCATGSQLCDLYVADSDALLKYSYNESAGTISGKTKLLNFPHSTADRHFTRTILFLSPPRANTLLISVGSSCNVCHETNDMYAKILAYNIDTRVLSDYATGLRNAVFIAENPINQIVFATEMGRDNLGDNIPPDEVNMIDPSRVEQIGIPNFGWPNCYGKNIHDTVFDKNTYIRNPCMEPFESPSWLDLQSHSAPLGLTFYKNNLYIAYHGSWNRTVPTGYKIVRTSIDGRGNPGQVTDFITGWLTTDGKKLGRPVDIKPSPDGSALYVSDDMSGVIYKISGIK